VRQAMAAGSIPEAGAMEMVDSELSEALRSFAENSRQQNERRALEEYPSHGRRYEPRLLAFLQCSQTQTSGTSLRQNER
jgi:hypothetical protein